MIKYFIEQCNKRVSTLPTTKLGQSFWNWKVVVVIATNRELT